MRKMKFVFVLAVLATCALAQAAYVTSTDQGGIVPIVNQGFENPANGKHNAWDIEDNRQGSFLTDVPGWSSDVTAHDSGVEMGGVGGQTGGDYRGFLMGGYSEWSTDPVDWVEPSTWNITGYKIKAGDSFMLAIDATNNWTANWYPQTPDMQMSLFYVAPGGARVTLATQTVTLPWDWGYQTYYLDVPDASAGLGRLLGIEIKNVTAIDSWINVDQVRLVPEPATLILLGLGGLLLRRKR
ncbi:MAG: PEP-CTERM sorting domain-containing protein [Sedimentisphaerales bacterium]